MLTACGGGGGGGDNAPSFPAYTGAITQAELVDPVDAEALVLDAYNGGEIGGGLTATTLSVASQETSGQPLVVGRIIQQTTLGLNWTFGPTTLEVIPPETGPCGGTLSGEVFQNTSGTSVTGYMAYDNYCSDNVILNGALAISGSITANGDVTIAMSTQGLTSTSGADSFTISGGFAMAFNANNPNSPVVLRINMLLSDGTTEKNFWVNNYQMTTTPDGAGGETVTISGRYYDFDRGYVDITTTTALQLDAFGVPQSGVLHYAGSNGTYADLMATGGGGYQLVVNGNFANTGTF